MDENYQCLKDHAYKTKQALENALKEKEAQKTKLEATYKLLDKTDDELKTIFLEIESDRENTGVSLKKEYNDSYWKWKDAEEANEKAQTALTKYDENYNTDIPDVMIELKEVKKELQEVKDEMQRQNEESKRELLQQIEEMMKILKILSFHYDEENERLFQNAQPFTGNHVLFYNNGGQFEGDFQNGMLRKGKRIFANGDLFEGDFQNKMPHKGKMTFANGDLFEGDFKNSMPHKGKMIFANGNYGLWVVPPFTGHEKEVDIHFEEPVEAQCITFKIKEWNNYPFFRCDVYVDNVLQSTPISQRYESSRDYDWCHDREKVTDSTLYPRTQHGWCPEKKPNEYVKLDLQERKKITGIRVGTSNYYCDQFVSNLALEFGN